MVNKISLIGIIVFLIAFSSLSVFATADNTIILKQGVISDIKVPCYFNQSYCPASIKCNLTLNYPNSTNFLNNVLMTNQNSFNNYTLDENQTATAGIYAGSIVCEDGAGNNGFSDIGVIINRDGIDLTGNMTAIILVVSALILLLAFFITMAIILENNMKLVFATLSFIMIPVVLFVSDAIIEDALMPQGIVNLVYNGYILSLYMLSAFILYVCIKLIMGLRMKSNKVEGATTTDSLAGAAAGSDKTGFAYKPAGFGSDKKYREKEEQDYEDGGAMDE